MLETTCRAADGATWIKSAQWLWNVGLIARPAKCRN